MAENLILRGTKSYLDTIKNKKKRDLVIPSNFIRKKISIAKRKTK